MRKRYNHVRAHANTHTPTHTHLRIRVVDEVIGGTHGVVGADIWEREAGGRVKERRWREG